MRNFLFAPNTSARLNYSLGFLAGTEKDEVQRGKLLALSSRSSYVPVNGTMPANDEEIDLMVIAVDKTAEHCEPITIWADLRENIRAQAGRIGQGETTQHAIGAGGHANTGQQARAG